MIKKDKLIGYHQSKNTKPYIICFGFLELVILDSILHARDCD